jgi:hypothetical protein
MRAPAMAYLHLKDLIAREKWINWNIRLRVKTLSLAGGSFLEPQTLI